MEIGVIGWCANTGLGNMILNWRRNLNVNHYLAVVNPKKPFREDWAREADIVTSHPISVRVLELFFKSIDVLLISESPLSPYVYTLAYDMGVKTVLVPRWEWIDFSGWQQVDWLIADSECCYDFLTRNMGFKHVSYIPFACDSIFKFQQREKCNVFIHNAGWGGVEGRKNTEVVVKAFEGLDIPLIIRTQKRLFDIPGNITVVRANDDDPTLCYKMGDVAIQPSKFEGLGLTILEAMASGIPTITTNASPMNEYFPDEQLLVKAKEVRKRRVKNPSAPVWEIDVDDLREKVKNLYQKDISDLSLRGRKIIDKTYSWQAQRNNFLTTLEKVYKGEIGLKRGNIFDGLNKKPLPFKVKDEV